MSFLSFKNCLMAGVVGMACQDCTGAVELFGEYEASEVVSQGDRAKREQEAGLRLGNGMSCRRPAVGGADSEDHVLNALVAAGTEPRGKFGRGKLTATTIEKDWESGKAGCLAGLFGMGEPGEEGGFRDESLGLTWDVGVDSIYIETGEGFVMGLWAGLGGFWTDMG
jgi:hypothetical protein